MKKPNKVNSKIERFNGCCKKIINSTAADIYWGRYKQENLIISTEEICEEGGYEIHKK